MTSPTKEKQYTVIDGGLSTELLKSGHLIDSDPLWGSRLLKTAPRDIVQAHKNYLNSGAEIITTCSYQASIEGFIKHLKLNVDEAKKLLASSVDLAMEAKNSVRNSNEIKIAASIGSYGAVQADGSEYHGKYVDNMTIEELMEWHRPKVETLLNANCDILALETIPAHKEGVALIKLLKQYPNAKAWLSFTCKNFHETAHGDLYKDTVEICLKELGNSFDQLVAIGINCSSPEFMESLISEARSGDLGRNPKIKYIVYPNRGEKWVAQTGWEGNENLPAVYTFVPKWVKVGVNYFGGCCRTDPEDISQIKMALTQLKDH